MIHYFVFFGRLNFLLTVIVWVGFHVTTMIFRSCSHQLIYFNRIGSQFDRVSRPLGIFDANFYNLKWDTRQKVSNLLRSITPWHPLCTWSIMRYVLLECSDFVRSIVEHPNVDTNDVWKDQAQSTKKRTVFSHIYLWKTKWV